MASNVLLMGFHDLASVMSQRVNVVGFTVVRDAVEAAVAEYNRMAEAMEAIFVTRRTDEQMRFEQPGTGTLQPIDERGIPQPVQEAGYYDVAWPIQGGGTAYGQNRVTRRLMTVEEVMRHTRNSLMRDADWRMRHILAALFTNVTYTFADKLKGNLTIQPLANGDTVTYLRRGGASSVDTHQIGSAALDAAALAAGHAELIEHPGNGDATVCFAPSASIPTIAAFTGFVEVDDPAIDPGASAERIRAVVESLVGPGIRLVGKMKGGSWVVEWPRVPDNYLIYVAVNAESTPLVMREYPDAGLQGLFPETHSANGADLEVRFIRYAGYGALNRVAAVVQRTNNATYAIPSGLTAPLPV